MRKTLIILAGVLFVPTFAYATPTSWDFASGILQPLQSQWAALVKADHFQATSTTASIFPYASTTGVSVSSLTNGNCVQAGIGGLLTTAASPCSTGGSPFPFTSTTNYGQAANATTTALWLQGSPFSLFASTTAVFVNASTSQLSLGTRLYDSLRSAGTPGQVLGLVNGQPTWVATSTSGGGSGTVGTGTTGQVPFYNANGTTLTATSSIFVFQNQDVAVGTTTDHFSSNSGGFTVARPTRIFPFTTNSGADLTIQDYNEDNFIDLDVSPLSAESTVDISDIDGGEITIDTTAGVPLIDLSNGNTSDDLTINPTNVVYTPLGGTTYTQSFPSLTGTFALGSQNSGLAYWGTDTGLRNIATTSVTCSGSVSCTTFTAIGPSPITISGSGGGSSGLGTTTPWNPGQLAQVINNSTVEGVSTSSLAFSGPFNGISALGALVGGSASTVTWTGLSTTSQPSIANLLYSTGGQGVAGVATSSASCTSASGITCNNFTVIGSAPTLVLSGIPNSSLTNSTIGLTDANSTLTIGGSPAALGGTLTATLNLAHTNNWSALQIFSGNASTTQLSVLDGAYFGRTATTTIDSLGNITALNGTSRFLHASTTRLSAYGPAFFGATATSTFSTAGILSLAGITQGSVLFSGASGAVSQDNSNFFYDSAGKQFGIGTTDPSAAFTIATTTANAVDIYDGFATRLLNFSTASTTGPILNIQATTTGNPTLFSIDQYGHQTASSTGAIPTLSSCGTGPSITAGSNDVTGDVVMGTGLPTGCTVTFAHAYSSTPEVMLSPYSGTVTAYVSARSTTSFTITISTGLSNDAFGYYVLMP